MLLYPTLKNSDYEQNPVVTGSSIIDTLRVYKQRTGGESAHRYADEHPDFALLVSSNATDSTRYSKLYMGPCLDFQLDNVYNLLILKRIRCMDYASSLEKPSEKDILRHLSPEGGPDRWDCRTEPEDLELSPAQHEGKHELHFFRFVDGRILILATPGLTLASLMAALTGWELLFCEDASNVVVKGRTRFATPNKVKGALVMVWERENGSGRDIQLLVRASDASKEPKSTKWLSTSCEWHP